MFCDFVVFCRFGVVFFSGGFRLKNPSFFLVFWLRRLFCLKILQIPLLFIVFFVFCDFSWFLFFLCCFFPGGFRLKIPSFFVVFWLRRLFCFKMAPNPLTFHRSFCVLRFLLFLVVLVLLFFFSGGFAAGNFMFFCRFFGSGGCFVWKWRQIPYFSSFFLCFAIFLDFCSFCVVFFLADFGWKFHRFLWIFWLRRLFCLKMVANPLTFHRFFVTALLSIPSPSAFTSTSRSSLFFHCGGAVDTKDIQWKNISMREKFLHAEKAKPKHWFWGVGEGSTVPACTWVKNLEKVLLNLDSTRLS